MHPTFVYFSFLAGLSLSSLHAVDPVQPRIIFSDGRDTDAVTATASAGYKSSLASLSARRTELLRRYEAASADRRHIVINEARQHLFAAVLHDLLPAWYGTPWAFEGISEIPGQGQIACGYFVTTTLRDAGFQLPRIRLAQQASQVIIRTLCDPATIKLYYQKPMSDITAYLDRHGPGLYIVGLDFHTGFVVNDGSSTAFIHSSYFSPPRAVCAEPIENHNPLSQSKYRVIGKLLGDAQIVQWLTQAPISIKSR
jgi:hypothetical protein